MWVFRVSRSMKGANQFNIPSIAYTSQSTTIKPVLILHVGPPKTGSTSLQCMLESLRSELEKDGIAYIGRPECRGMNIHYRHKKLFRLFSAALVTGYDCHRQLNGLEGNHTDGVQVLPSCWDDFTDQLESYRQAGTNVIFSDEAMSNRVVRSQGYRPSVPYPWTALKSTLEGMGWDVRVLIVHRPLYDYLPSVYIEQYKEGPAKRKLNQWFGGGDGHGNDREICPSQGGRAVPRPFDTDTHEITIARLLNKQQEWPLYPTPAQVYELFRDHGFTIILVDMMEHVTGTNGKDLNMIQHIICDKIPGTTHTCNAVDVWNAENKELNPSLSLHYDFIAVEACHKGLLNGTLVSRDVARHAIQRRQEHDLGLSPNDFALVCPDDETLMNILRVSLDHERRLRTSQWDQYKESRHKERFWKVTREKKKCCNVDSKEVVKDESWIEFFSTIDKE